MSPNPGFIFYFFFRVKFDSICKIKHFILLLIYEETKQKVKKREKFMLLNALKSLEASAFYIYL